MSLLDRLLPEPDFVTRDPAAVTQAMVAQYEALTGKTLYPAQLERLLIDVMSYRESLMREALQDAAKLNLVRYSRGVMLDMLGENVGVARITGLTNAAGEALPDETDDSFRERIVLAPSAFSVAGPVDAYKFFALGAHPEVWRVAVLTPQLQMQGGQVVSANGVPPGVVQIVVLTQAGLASQAVKDAVLAACSAKAVRPLGDLVQVIDPQVVDFEFDAGLVLYTNADAALALAEAQAAAAAYVARVQGELGVDVVLAQMVQALKVYGVYDVMLAAPAAGVVLSPAQWARCTRLNVAVTGRAAG